MAPRLYVSSPGDPTATTALTVLGGKSSCRRKFVLDVLLIGDDGTIVSQDLNLFASVVFYHDKTPVVQDERPPSAEPPLFTTFNGVEFPAHNRPTRMIGGRASFKLAISLLSSKYDNRLFCIAITPQPCTDEEAPVSHQEIIPQPGHSRPIRSLSRKRGHARAGLGIAQIPVHDAGKLFRDANGLRTDTDCPPLTTPSCISEGSDPGDDAEDHCDGRMALTAEGGNATRADYLAGYGGHTATSLAAEGGADPAMKDASGYEAERPSKQCAVPGPSTPSLLDPVSEPSRVHTQQNSGAFRPFASVGAFKHPQGDQTAPPLGKRSRLMQQTGPEAEEASPSGPLTEQGKPNPQNPVSAGLDSAGLNPDGGAASWLVSRSLQDDERSLELMEASLAELGMELQRRREELQLKKKRFMEEEERMRALLFSQQRCIPHAPPIPAQSNHTGQRKS